MLSSVNFCDKLGTKFKYPDVGGEEVEAPNSRYFQNTVEPRYNEVGYNKILL